MKTLIITLVLGAGLLFGLHAQAGTYPDYDGKSSVKVANCTLVTTRAEADSTHVYTLNPSHTSGLNDAYRQYWARNARCSELQFHIDHNTTIMRLKEWLRSINLGWFKNLNSSPYKNQTVSAGSNEWFFIKDGVARRIPDILTAWSWGLLIDDRISIPATVTTDFYKNVTFGAPLPFNSGQYASEIRTIWKDGKRDYSALPGRLGDNIAFLEAGLEEYYEGVFTGCVFRYPGTRTGESYSRLLDWSWMLRNPGCALSS